MLVALFSLATKLTIGKEPTAVLRFRLELEERPAFVLAEGSQS